MTRLIQWFIDNPIAANLLMAVIILGGVVSATQMEKEVFPRVDTQYIDISMSYPGAGPNEVEQQISVRIEEAIAEVEGIKRIESDSRNGFASVTVEVFEDKDPQQVLNDIKAGIDAVNTFPQSAEKPVVSRRIQRTVLMYFALYGDVDEATLKKHGTILQEDLSQLPGVSRVAMSGTRDDEVGIEISEERLRHYRLTFDEVAAAIRGSSLNVPAGMIRSDAGNIQVQTRSQAYTADDFANIVVRHDVDGGRLLLADVAAIDNGFAEQNRDILFNGRPALAYEVYISDQPDLYAATETARNYLQQAEEFLPASMGITITFEMQTIFADRLTLLSSNAMSGLLLVFAVLMLFLRPLLALWVCVGIVVAFAGAIWLMPVAGMSLNMITMFAFLMVLGIVVDDAIIVGESIYARHQDGMKDSVAASSGAKRVAKPVVFAIASTAIFFAPMLGMPPELANTTYPIAVVVMLCLLFSLIESLFILPCHLKHMGPEKPSRYKAFQKLADLRHTLSNGLQTIATRYYQPMLTVMVKNYGATLALFAVMFAISVAIFQGLPKSFFPTVPADFVNVNIRLPEGTPYRDSRELLDKIVAAGESLRTDPVLTERNQGKTDFLAQVTASASENNLSAFIGMNDALNQTISSQDIAERLREKLGPLPLAKEYNLNFTFQDNSADIRLNLTVPGNDIALQQQATDTVSSVLATYAGVFNVRNSLDAERAEVELTLKPYAETLGLRMSDIARQVRQGFYGEEVQRIPRGKEDVRVMLRYPAADRQQLQQLDTMRIRTTGGVEVPLLAVANVALVPGFTSIQRVDRRRNISITAEVKDGADASAIVASMNSEHLSQWKLQYPGLQLNIDGNIKTQQQSDKQLAINLLTAFVAVYVIMAIAFKSYFQPLLVLTAIPFGFMGAVIGHKLLGHQISLMSQLGFLACAGVVINDNLVLLDRINQLKQEGKDTLTAVLNAGKDRFRAIILTSITTFIGLLPLLFEQSIQAKFLIPMVISLSFGVLLATTVTLVLVPSLYWAGYNLSCWIRSHSQKSCVNGSDGHNRINHNESV